MLGNFHEVSVHSDDLVSSLAFYEQLGFAQLETGDVWEHSYAVVSDGLIVIGLHQHAFDSPALTFVRPDLKNYLYALKRAHIKLAFQKLADDEFNELGFADPSGIIITLLEARTHGPQFDDRRPSLCGRFLEVSLGVDDVESAARFWERIGFEVVGSSDAAHPAMRLCREGLNVGLHQTRCPRALSFIGNDLEARIEFLKTKGFMPDRHTPIGHGASLVGPEGTQLLLFEDDWI
jgi:catechol 2,3-dioxygenase-like lactoylglutathione lyase family enzyme